MPRGMRIFPETNFITSVGHGWQLALTFVLTSGFAVFGFFGGDFWFRHFAIVGGLVGYAAILYFSRCPRCGCRYVWRVVSTSGLTKFGEDLINLGACQDCGYTGRDS